MLSAQLDRTAPSTSRRRPRRTGLGPPKRSRLEEMEGAEAEEQDVGEESPRLERRGMWHLYVVDKKKNAGEFSECKMGLDVGFYLALYIFK